MTTDGSGRETRGRGSRGLVVATAALAIIAVAGVVIARNLPPWPWFPAPSEMLAAIRPEPKPDPIAPDPADFRTRLTIIPGRGGGPATVVLGRATGTSDLRALGGTDQSLLDRELVRQAVLMAARDERGLATRDALIDGEADAPGADEALELSSLVRPGRARLLVRPAAPEAGPSSAAPVLALELEGGPAEDDVAPKLARLLAAEAATSLARLLDERGVRGEPNALRPGAAVPEGVEAKLETLGLVEHFEAVRALHRAIRADGESPARLGALARAYAQLAALTAHHWSPAHRAFRARAMLYAERLADRAPDSAQARRERALVRGLGGFHSDALADLDAAAALDAKTPSSAPPPAWLAVLDAGLKYDLARLEAAEGPYENWAAFWRMAALEFPGRTRILVRAAESVLRRAPDCGRACEVIGINGSLGDQHRSTVVGPASFQALFRARLGAIPDLPEPARKALGREADEPAVADALAESGRPGADDQEPSWGALAELAREARFVHVLRRMTFMAWQWCVPTAEFWAEARPLVEGHRYLPLAASMSGDREDMRAFAEFAEGYDASDVEPHQAELVRQMQRVGFERGKGYWAIALMHGSHGVGDLGRTLYDGARNQPIFAKTLLGVSPHSPFARAMLVRYDWPNAEPKAEAWAREVGDAPAFLKELGLKRLEQGRHDEAQKLLGRYIELSPDLDVYQSLADSYWAKGDHGKWASTLESFLEGEDSGLDHAKVQVKLADYYLLEGDPKRAKPYSDAAAATWAAWAMACAARVDEALGDLDSAEGWSRRITERYDDWWATWYLFCQRTGRGELDGAREMARAGLRLPEPGGPDSLAFFHWLEDEPDRAIRILEGWMEAQPAGPAAMSLMLLYDQTGANEKRDEMLRQLSGGIEGVGPKSAAVCRLMQDALSDPEKGLVLADVDAQIAAIQEGSPFFLRLSVGRFLINRGRPEDARKYLKACAEDLYADGWSRAAAALWLRRASPEEAKPDETPAPAGGDERART